MPSHSGSQKAKKTHCVKRKNLQKPMLDDVIGLQQRHQNMYPIILTPSQHHYSRQHNRLSRLYIRDLKHRRRNGTTMPIGSEIFPREPSRHAPGCQNVVQPSKFRVVPKSYRPKGQLRSTRNEFPIRADTEILENIQYGGSSVVKTDSQRSRFIAREA